MTAIVSINNALCRIGRQVVLRIENFSIEPGQHWCVFGPNGAGKTLLSNLIMGKRHESGSYVSYSEGFNPVTDIYVVSFEEQQRLWLKDNRLDISEFSIEVKDNGTVVEQLIRSGRSKDGQDEQLLAKLRQQLGLGDLFERGIRFLSSGQTRKVLIARALYAHRSGGVKLVIFDEPLESIDRESSKQIARCIDMHLDKDCCSIHLCRRQGDILPHATHLALMRDFQICAQGLIAELSQSAEFASLLAHKPVIPVDIPVPPSASSVDDSAYDTLIELQNVTANYAEQRVLSNINWRMEANQHVLIEGPNGCGKSTLLSLIDGENHKGYGQDVFLFGRRKGTGESIWEVKSNFGIVSNELHNKYVKGWRVLEVVVSGFFDSVGLYDDSGSVEKDLAKQWLAVLGIIKLQQDFYQELSFGQQRLVLLARAMVKHPRILVLDEPCVGLDDYHRHLILQTLDVIAEQTRTQILYVSHVQGEQPQCINQHLRFIESKEGGYTLQQTAV